MFFQQLLPLLKGCDLTLFLSEKDGQITVSFLPKGKNGKNGLAMAPLVITGSDAELDENLISVITEPLQKVSGLLHNAADFSAKVTPAAPAKATPKAAPPSTPPKPAQPVKPALPVKPQEEEEGSLF